MNVYIFQNPDTKREFFRMVNVPLAESQSIWNLCVQPELLYFISFEFTDFLLSLMTQ